MSTNLDLKRFKPLFGNWWYRIEPFFLSGEMDKVYDFLKSESKKGKKLAPASSNTFRVFKEVDYNDLQCVVLCMDPYFTFVNNEPIASGVALDCSVTGKLQPSLRNFYSGIEEELYSGLTLERDLTQTDLSYLSKQGVMMLNAALTVEKDKAGSHIAIWNTFTTFLLKEVIAPTGVPILFLGKEAQSYRPLVEKTNYCYSLSHPASASYNGGIWKTEEVFKKINKHIWESNKEIIHWLYIDFDSLPF